MPQHLISNLVVTGSSGYLGRKVVNTLMSHGFNITEIDLGNPTNPVDLIDTSSLSTIQVPDEYRLIHLAFPLPGKMRKKEFSKSILKINENLSGTFSPSSTLLVSSTAVYALDSKDLSRVEPWEAYGQLKLQTEKHFLEAFRNVTIFRPGTLVEPHRVSSMMNFIQRLRFSRIYFIPGDGAVFHPFTHTEDLVDSILSWAKNPEPTSGVYNLIAKEPITFAQISKSEELKGFRVKLRLPTRILRIIGSDDFPIMGISRWHFSALTYDLSDQNPNIYNKNFRKYTELFNS